MSPSSERRRQNREAAARHYARYKTAINEERRRRYKVKSKVKLKSIGGVTYYTIADLATLMDRSPVTLKRWIAAGKLPLPAATYRGTGLYTEAEAEIILSAWKLAGKSVSGRDGLNRIIWVKGKRYPWYQWVTDRIYEIRSKSDG